MGQTAAVCACSISCSTCPAPILASISGSDAADLTTASRSLAMPPTTFAYSADAGNASSGTRAGRITDVRCVPARWGLRAQVCVAARAERVGRGVRRRGGACAVGAGVGSRAWRDDKRGRGDVS